MTVPSRFVLIARPLPSNTFSMGTFSGRTVTALEDAIVAKVSEAAFSDLGSRHPQLYRLIAQELAGRILQLESRSIE